MAVARKMLSFERDESSAGAGAWVVLLDCGHRRHVRHRPPLSSYPWIDDADARAQAIGDRIECERCVQRIWPDDLESYHATAIFDEHTVPAGLLGDHQTKAGVWGRLEVLSGALTLVFVTPLDERVHVVAGEWAAIPPELRHHVELEGGVRFRVQFCRRTA
jgi:tellurite methyltransferase